MGYGFVLVAWEVEGAMNCIGSDGLTIGRVPSFGHGRLEEGDGLEMIGWVERSIVVDCY